VTEASLILIGSRSHEGIVKDVHRPGKVASMRVEGRMSSPEPGGDRVRGRGLGHDRARSCRRGQAGDEEQDQGVSIGVTAARGRPGVARGRGRCVELGPRRRVGPGLGRGVACRRLGGGAGGHRS